MGPRADPPVAGAVPAGGDLRGGRRDRRRSTPTTRRPTRTLIEELGDLLYQIEFHATIAEQQGRFTIADVARRASTTSSSAATRTSSVDVERRRRRHAWCANWDAIKRDEKGRTVVFDGVATSQPALTYAYHVQRKAAKVGFDWPDVDGALPKIAEETAELHEAIADRGDRARIDGRARRPAVRGRQRRPPPRRRAGGRAARRHPQVPPPLRGRRAPRRRTRHRPERRGPGDARRAVGRGQGFGELTRTSDRSVVSGRHECR